MLLGIGEAHFVIHDSLRAESFCLFVYLQDPLVSPTMSFTNADSIPVLLLKTKSSPGDAYEELFSSPAAGDGFNFKPEFLPVLEHRFEGKGLNRVRQLLKSKAIGAKDTCPYGGLIFTSQRAVEAFARVIEDARGPSIRSVREGT